VEIRQCWAENGHVKLPLPYFEYSHSTSFSYQFPSGPIKLEY